ncbi:MAG TPA: hypothetical protein VLB80_00420 [Candidatus Babeliales bacterium]|nr:hypothetical protein [Candidatus Babeliales bacterium]
MFKKVLLSALFAVSTLATAQVQLDLDLTIISQDIERHATGTIIIDENKTTSVVFDNLDTLIISFSAQIDGQIVKLQTQFFKAIENSDDVVVITEPLPVEVSYNESATITVNEADNNGSLILVVTPSIVE